MSQYLCRANFNCQTVAGSCGVSEVYGIVGDSPTPVQAAFKALIDARLALCVNDVRCVYAGITDSDLIGDFLPNTDLIDTVGTFSVTPADQTGPFTATRLVRFTNDIGTVRGMRQVRLLPVSCFNGDNLVFSPTLTWNTNYGTWTGLVVASACIVRRDPGAVIPPFYTFTPITQFFTERDSTRRVGRPFELLVGRRVIR